MKRNHHLELARHRMDKAAQNLSMARENYHLGHFDEAVAKSYYSILTSMRALLALLHMDSKRQEGVITLFHQHLVKKGLFPRGFGRIVSQMKRLREDADYGDYVEITQQQAEIEIRNAEEFLKTAEKTFVKLTIHAGRS